MAKIKICGLRREQDIEYVNALFPDYIGFILTPGFRRSITAETAERLKAILSPDIKAVGVFVDDSVDNIMYFVDKGIIDIVQLHGSETPDFCKKINAPVIKFFKPDSFDKISEYDTDFYLFDSGTGTGKAFDWQTIPKTDKPFFLAGGLGADNICDAIKKINPYAVDLSSSVERDGYKDYDKIKQIMECVKNE